MDTDGKELSPQLPGIRASQATASPQALPTSEFEPQLPLSADATDDGGRAGDQAEEADNAEAADPRVNQDDPNQIHPTIETKDIVINPFFEDLETHDKGEGAIIIDPTTTERFFWTDPVTTLKREIWRPGDGDGDRLADYYEKPGPTAPLETRWRFYQSRTGPGPVKQEKNMPPKHVILDDRAAQEVVVSDIPRTHITKYWPHDFGGNGSIRARRPHRGRGAIGDFEASGKDRFHFTNIANRKVGERYYFTGEASYKPVIWNTNDYRLAIGIFKPVIKKLSSPPPKKELKWNQHGHNQFTPANQLVKFGAQRKGTSYSRFKPKPNEPAGGVRGGRNRVQPLTKSNIGSPPPTSKNERVERWRKDTRGSAQNEREDSLVPEQYEGREGAKRRRLDAESAYGEAEEGEETEAYITYLETCIVESKVITDDQQAEIERLKRQLSEAKKVIEGLEGEVERLKGE